MYMYMCVYIYTYTHLPTYLPTYLPIYLPIYTPKPYYWTYRCCHITIIFRSVLLPILSGGWGLKPHQILKTEIRNPPLKS